jgi:hypothetical protein
MAGHKKIPYLTGYCLVVAAPNPIDINAMQDLDQIYSAYVIFHITSNHHQGHNTTYQYNLLNLPIVTLDTHQKKYIRKNRKI